LRFRVLHVFGAPMHRIYGGGVMHRLGSGAKITAGVLIILGVIIILCVVPPQVYLFLAGLGLIVLGVGLLIKNGC